MIALAAGLVAAVFAGIALKREDVRWPFVILWGLAPVAATFFLGYWGIPIAAVFAAAMWKIDLSRT
jgi:hypothetical protein